MPKWWLAAGAWRGSERGDLTRMTHASGGMLGGMWWGDEQGNAG